MQKSCALAKPATLTASAYIVYVAVTSPLLARILVTLEATRASILVLRPKAKTLRLLHALDRSSAGSIDLVTDTLCKY
jgi:hypothetical protein